MATSGTTSEAVINTSGRADNNSKHQRPTPPYPYARCRFQSTCCRTHDTSCRTSLEGECLMWMTAERIRSLGRASVVRIEIPIGTEFLLADYQKMEVGEQSVHARTERPNGVTCPRFTTLAQKHGLGNGPSADSWCRALEIQDCVSGRPNGAISNFNHCRLSARRFTCDCPRCMDVRRRLQVRSSICPLQIIFVLASGRVGVIGRHAFAWFWRELCQN